MINGVEYIDYDKISDDLCWLGNKCIVRMVVKLANKGKDGTRYHFHKEFKYDTQYINKKEAVTIRRSFSYYISIDSLEYRNASVIITINDILLLRAKIQEAFSWFYDKTFAMKRGKMIILEKKPPAIVDGLIGGKFIAFEPIVYVDYEDKQSKGIRITLGDNNVFTDVPIETFNGFCYIIGQINMFESAQNMINYIGHPDFGTNLYTFEKSEYASDEQPKNIIKERTIEPKKNKSFFDSIDDL